MHDGPYPERIARPANGAAVGKIQIATGSVTVTRANTVVSESTVGDILYQGDLIETGDDSSVVIRFVDGTVFQLQADGRIELDERSAGVAPLVVSPLLRVVRGAFSFIAGKVAANARLIIDTPVARIQSRAGAAGIGSLVFSALTIGLVHELKAASADLGLLDDGTIDYRDLKHGVFEVRTKELHPRTIVHDDPSVTLELRRHGGGTVSVDEVANSPVQMAQLQSAFQGAYATFILGQQDPQIQQWQGGPNDHANANPDSAPSSVGSSTAVNDLNSGGGGLGQIGGTQTALNIGGGGFPSVLPAGGAPVGGADACHFAGGWRADVDGGMDCHFRGQLGNGSSWSDGFVPGAGTTVQILDAGHGHTEHR